MSNTVKSIAVIGTLLVVLVLIEINKPLPLVWEASFLHNDKMPYGTKICYDLLPAIFPEQNISTVYEPIYNQLNNNNTIKNKAHYIIIGQSITADELDLSTLLDYIYGGGYAFIALNNFGEALKDTLGFNTKYAYNYSTLFNLNPSKDNKDSSRLQYIHPQLSDSIYSYHPQMIRQSFSAFDSSRTQVIAQNQQNAPTLLRINHGIGALLLDSNPLVYTNYNLLIPSNEQYIEKALSHLPPAPIYWDEYYKLGRKGSDSPLRYFLSQKPLKSAIYLAFFTSLLFIFFEAKRRQRIIPIIKPLGNSSLSFVQTVGMLYYQHGNHKDIADKKITYLFDYIRQRYLLSKVQFSPVFYQQLAQKSGSTIQFTSNLFKTISDIQAKERISEKELLDLHQQIEKFYALSTP
jgi:hypothetical protein